MALGDEEDEDASNELQQRVSSLKPNKCCIVLHTVNGDSWIVERLDVVLPS